MAAKDQFLQIRVTPAQKAAIKQQADRAGMDMSSYVLARLLPAPVAEFQSFVAGLTLRAEERRFVLASIHDFLSSLSRREFAQATAEAPRVPLEPFAANYLAAMLETAAHGLRIAPPEWVAEIRPLDSPRFGMEAPGLRLHLLTHSPPAFRRRNIFVDASIGSRA